MRHKLDERPDNRTDDAKAKLDDLTQRLQDAVAELRAVVDRIQQNEGDE